MNRSRTLILGMAFTLLLAILVACGGDDDEADATQPTGQEPAATATEADQPTEASGEAEATQEDEPTATSEEATATSEPDEAETPAPTVAPTDTADDTPSPEGDTGRIVGSAAVEDESDDVVNLLMQEPDAPMPGIDLVRVSIDADGEQIVATVETSGAIAQEASDDSEVSFDVHLWQDGKPAYALSFHRDGTSDWEATITDFSVGLGDEEDVETVVTVDGNTISAAFPTSMLPELESEFEWYASVMLSEDGMLISPDNWFDGAPENVIELLADPDEFVEFPQ